MPNDRSPGALREQSIHVLLIEDDADDTFLLMRSLAEPGWPSFRFTCECVETLAEGLKVLAADDNKIEVVLLDLMLPDSRGLETIRRVRDSAPDMPVVVLTGLQDEAMGLQAIINGAQDYQVKGSVNSHSLKRTISYAVERHRMLARMKEIIEKAADGMVIVNPKRSVLYANPAAEKLFGVRVQELLGKPFPYSVPAGSPQEIRIPARGPDIPERIAEVRASEIEWGGEPASLASVRDITELRRLEQLKAEVRERRRMDKLKDELMDAVSHEIRAPLTIIRAGIGNLREGFAGNLTPRQSTMVDLVHKSGLRLQKIVDNILDLSRLESGRAHVEFRQVPIAELIRETVAGYRILAGEQRLLLQEEIPTRLPDVRGDADMIAQVLVNLMENAIRFTETRVLVKANPVAGGRDLASSRSCVQISVLDDGRGIPKGRIGELFNKFVQIDREARRGTYKGTGLGLALCKQIIERHEGRIWIESDEGRGTQVHFILPQFQEVKQTHETNARSS